MTRRAGIAIVAGVLAATGCGMTMRSVPVDATPAQWERLAGQWRGEYTIADVDRRGLIEFRLEAAEHAAFGEVLMIPDRRSWATHGTSDRMHPSPPPETEPRLLAIRFVAADRDGIRGAMAPYWDPDRQCQASAWFTGSVDGDILSGRFDSTCEDGARVLRGAWHVERVPR
jgi:hypothetical protein